MITLHAIGNNEYASIFGRKEFWKQTDFWLTGKKERIYLSNIDKKYAASIILTLRSWGRTYSSLVRAHHPYTLDQTYSILDTPLFKALEAKSNEA